MIKRIIMAILATTVFKRLAERNRGFGSRHNPMRRRGLSGRAGRHRPFF